MPYAEEGGEVRDGSFSRRFELVLGRRPSDVGDLSRAVSDVIGEVGDPNGSVGDLSE